MGMFDELSCRYPLPVAGANDLVFQTKSLDCVLDGYEIGADGQLRHQEYDLEDRSDPTKTGLARLAGMATRVNQRWVSEPLTGEVRFYGTTDGSWSGSSWLEFSAYFVAGRLTELHQIKGHAQ